MFIPESRVLKNIYVYFYFIGIQASIRNVSSCTSKKPKKKKKNSARAMNKLNDKPMCILAKKSTIIFRYFIY